MDRANGLNLGIAIVILSLVFVAPLCDAAVVSGNLDLTFGTGGKVITDFGGNSEEAHSVTIDSQERIVVAGYTNAGGTDQFTLARYNTDGRLDSTFGTNGKVITEFGEQARANVIAIDNQGRIVAAGYTDAGDTRYLALARYNSDGSLDTTFGTNGKVTINFFGWWADAQTLAIDRDGKIIAAGSCWLSRYNTDGSLDTTFSSDGVVDTEVFDGNCQSADAIALDDSSKILVAGTACIYVGSYCYDNFALSRYNPDGSLDTTFGTDGKVSTVFSEGDSRANALAMDSGGKIVVAGNIPGIYYFALARYNPDGSPDSSFGIDGKVTTDLAGFANALAVDSSGKIVVAGYSGNDFALARYNTDGSLDNTFGTEGKVTTDFGGFSDEAFGIEIDSSGKIMVAGTASGHDFALARYYYNIDKTPPTPNPMTWETIPYLTGTNSISMVSTTAIDPTPSTSPISYYFDFVGSPTGGLGGKDSGWQSGSSYTNSNLRPNHKYGYRVKAEDGSNNQTTYSTTQYAYTAIQAPAEITFGTITTTSIQVRSTNTPTGLSWGKSGLLIENTTNADSSGWKRNNSLWTSKSLSPNTSYSFQAKARNGDGIETGYSPSASRYTRASLPGKAPFSDVTRTSIRANWTTTNPLGTQYFCQNVTTKTDSGWITDTSWNSDNLSCGISYSFRVKARNQDGVETGWTSLGSQSTVKCVLLLKPNGGDTIPSGSNYDIQWEATPAAESFDLFYSLDSGVSWISIAKDVRNTIYSWTVPKTTGNKKMCFVRVVGYNDTRAKKIGSDTSDKLFTIEVVKLTSPNGGPPSLKRDETINITWTAYETTKPITKVQLYYTKDGGTTYNSIITLSGAYPPGDYSQSWTVPPVGTTSKTKCKVKVVLKDAKGVIRGSDVSDNFFTIEPFPPVMVTVPNVVGMTQADAQSVITVAKLIVGTITQANSATVPAGNVISQNPAAGSSVAEGSTVSLVISTGPGMVTVPNVIGMTQARAESAIVGAKLKVGTISQANSGTVPAGNVISQNPAAGTSVTQGSSVDLVISIGSLMVTVPNVVGMTQAAAGSAITAAGLTVGAVTTSYSNTVTTGDVISQSPGGGFSIPQGYEVDLVISLGHWSEPLPPDPGTVAPPIDPTVATNVATATEFLYTGANPIQTGVAPGTIDSKRVAVLRGKVLNRNGQALPGVTITILSHPEFGQTLSRLDGMFDLVVNGGGYLTVHYQKAGYLSAQRQVNAPWQDYAWLPDVILTQLDNQVTPIDLTSNEPIQIARGSVVTDDDGTRQATLLIPQGTQAQMVFADGSTQPLTTLSVRATEYTIGPNGPKAMPAELPPTSGYTYAVELSADEALSAGATAVSLNQPLYFYVEDFIGFPVGGAVPTGYYDRQKGQWIASDNGRVIQILGITGGLANIDTNGDGTPDDAATLAALNITDTERQRLAILYPQTPKQLWRVPMTHFTPWDCNWPYGPPLDAEPPKQGPPRQDTKMDDFTIECRSLVECQNQVLRERVTITGTPFTLSYSSAMVPGRESHILDIPLSGDTLPTSLMRIDLQIDVAGRLFSESFSPQSNLTYHFAWYGLEDAYGRRLQGVQQATVRIDYVYPAVYYPVWADMELSFGRMGPSTTFINSRAATTITVQQTWSLTLGESPIASQVGGWTLSAHHVYDPGARILHLGNGRRVSAQGVTTTGVINTVAGTGIPNNSSEPNYNGDGIPATQANLNIYWATGIAISPDGIIYIADTLNYRVRRISPDGIITTIAGTGSPGYNGDGIPATEAQLYWPMGVAIMSDGSLYISDFASPWGYEVSRVRRVGLDGIITTVAGGGSEWPGDGRPATEAGLSIPAKIALGPDGSLYIVENWGSGGAGYRVRRVGPDGIITTVAGTGERGYNGDGIPATQAMLYNPYDVAVGSDGSLYIADSGNNRVRRVGPDGIITTVAGDGSGWFHGDGGLATEAGVAGPAGVAVGPDGNLYIGDGHRVVRKVGSDGIITTVAGSGSNWDFYYHGDGTPATQANLPSPYTVAVGPDGSLYILDHGLQRLFKVSPVFPGFSLNNIAIPSEDGGEVYEFTPGGRHLRTLNALTGAVLYEFTYDSNGLLIQTKNIDGGNITTIERNAEGNPIAIVGPYGQRTALTLDANGYLAEIRNPAGESLHFVYSSGGLLKEMTDAKGNRSVYDYDTLGRLVKDTDAAGGSLSLARTDTLNGFDVTTATGLGKVTTHRVEDLSAGGMSMVDTYQDGTIVQKEIGTDGVRTITMSDGTVASLTQGPDPRFGMQAPIVTNTSLKTPSGLEKITTVERTATLSDPSNRLSLQTLTDNVNINGRLYTNIIDMGTMQRTLTTPEGRKLVTTFDARGRIIKKQFGNLNPISYTYDTRGRMSTITRGIDAEARGFAITYNNQGYPATISGPLSANVSLEYDAAGRVLRQILGDGRTIAFGYDAAGNIASITPPGKPSHLFTYSSINLAQEYTAPDAGTGPNVTALSFDLDKKLTSIMRPDGSAVTMSYDSAGRPATKSFPQGTLTYGYDPVTGVLSSLTAPDGGVLSMKYDGYLNTKSTWTGAVTGTVDRVYDNNFSLTRRSVNGQAIDFSYDDDGLLVQAGALTLTRDIANGFVIGTALGGVNDTWHYTGFGELDEYQATYNSGDYFTAQYTYDKLGRIVQKTEEIIGMGSNVYGYSYDVTSRLTGVSLNGGNIAAYIYDSNGNRLTFLSPSTTITGSYDAQDRLTQYGDITYTYTANGELASKRDAGGTTTYQYDALGNLTEVTLPSGTAIKYVIDGANRRIGKKVNNVLINGLLYKDDLKPVAELDAANNVVLRFVYGSRINAPDYMIKGGNTYRIISDHLGSPRLVVDVATGQITQRLDYDEFGRVLVDTNPGFQPFGFAGGLYDPDTGFVRFGARDYDPQTGRWTTKDPVLFSGKSLNLYAYALNNPVNLSDADGLKYGPGDINKSFAGPAEALQEPAPGSVERTEQGNGNYMEYGKTKDGIDFERACENGTCLERTWDPLTETFGEAMTSYDCEGSGCSDLTKKAEKENADFDPRNPFPGESLPPAQPVTPSPSLDLPPLVPIPLPSDKSCRLNIWRDASGNIINVIKVK